VLALWFWVSFRVKAYSRGRTLTLAVGGDNWIYRIFPLPFPSVGTIYISDIYISDIYPIFLTVIYADTEQGCSLKKEVRGRLKQDLDKDLQLHRILILLY